MVSGSEQESVRTKTTITLKRIVRRKAMGKEWSILSRMIKRGSGEDEMTKYGS